MRVIGIDPGVEGAAALIADAGVAVFDLPVAQYGATKQISGPLLTALLVMLEPDQVVIEDNRASPQSRTSGKTNYSMGLSMGVCIGVVGALGIPLDRLSPRTWQRVMGMATVPAAERKEAARQRAIELWPNLATEGLTRKKDHNRAEALLIAEAARRRMPQHVAT